MEILEFILLITVSCLMVFGIYKSFCKSFGLGLLCLMMPIAAIGFGCYFLVKREGI